MILVITGPPGVGKTTIAKEVSQRIGFEYISGDDIKRELFPDIKTITDHPTELEAVKQEIRDRASALFESGKDVVIDYVILGREQIQLYKELLGEELKFIVLMPSETENLQRDDEREIWTSGKEAILRWRSRFLELKNDFGSDSFIDTSELTVEQTMNKVLSLTNLRNNSA